MRRYLDYLKHLLNRYDWKSRDIVRHVSISFSTFGTFGGWINGSLPVPPCRAPSSRENVPELAVSLMSRTFWGENSVYNLHLRKLQKAPFCSHVFFVPVYLWLTFFFIFTNFLEHPNKRLNNQMVLSNIYYFHTCSGKWSWLIFFNRVDTTNRINNNFCIFSSTLHP